jgi:hypothetical protein
MLATNSTMTATLDSPMAVTVNGLIHEFEELWWSCDSDLPELGVMYTLKEKLAREAHLSNTIDSLLVELEHISHSPDEHQQTQDRLLVLLSSFARTAFGVEDRHISAVLTTGILDATREFIRQARIFDPLISFNDIYQASRNAWTMNLLQLLFNLPVTVSPAVVGYSLLYPYTDNYLDNPRITTGAKQAFSLRFRQRLEGKSVNPTNNHEQKIFDLVGLIESQYERWQYPEIYESLLVIHTAQTNSMKLLNSQASPYELDILGLTFEKGGASVLADGYLVAGTLTKPQREFTFHYGTFTQLMDDLEDIEADRRTGLVTIFSQTAKRWSLDTVTNRAFQYGYKMLARIDEFNTPGLDSLWELLHMAITPLLIDSISQVSGYYTPSYLKQLEAHYPFRFGFMKKQRKRLNNKINRNRYLLENMIRVVG